MIVVLCFAITIVATALIYWRWANVTEPTSYVVIQGEEEHNGTVVTVTPEDSPEVIAMVPLSAENHYTGTIFLQPGSYTLTATQHGETLIHGAILMIHRRWKTVLLPRRNPTPSDTSQRRGVS